MSLKYKLFVVLCLLSLFTASSIAGTLFVGADTEDFAGTLPDRLGKVTVSGSAFVSQTIIPLDFFLNGLADIGGGLIAGTPSANTLNTLDYNGVLQTSIAAPGIPNSGCCNEEMLLVGATFYHVHYSDAIRVIDRVTGVQTGIFDQSDVVGMALVNGEIWITKWAGRSVGKWDPATNTFTPVFSVPTNAGGLAFDPANQILWVGRQGGVVEPYDLAGALLAGGFQPFGDIPDTIDGLTFLGEAVPEPGTWALLGFGLAALALRRVRRA